MCTKGHLLLVSCPASSNQRLLFQLGAQEAFGCGVGRETEATVADTANNPEAALEEKNRGELVRQALTQLSPEHREIIDLVYCHEKSVDECAQVLGIPAATVNTRMFYARKKRASSSRQLNDRLDRSPRGLACLAAFRWSAALLCRLGRCP